MLSQYLSDRALLIIVFAISIVSVIIDLVFDKNDKQQDNNDDEDY